VDLEETEANNDCTGEGQQQFNRPTDRPTRDPSSEMGSYCYPAIASGSQWWPDLARCQWPRVAATRSYETVGSR
jgi:hypothetical protein